MNYFEKRWRERNEVLWYRVEEYRNNIVDHIEDYYLKKQALRHARKVAKKDSILVRIYAIYLNSKEQIAEFDGAEKYDEPMGLLSWLFIILGIAFVACAIILPIFKP